MTARIYASPARNCLNSSLFLRRSAFALAV
jgi:hypothetical protein